MLLTYINHIGLPTGGWINDTCIGATETKEVNANVLLATNTSMSDNVRKSRLGGYARMGRFGEVDGDFLIGRRPKLLRRKSKSLISIMKGMIKQQGNKLIQTQGH